MIPPTGSYTPRPHGVLAVLDFAHGEGVAFAGEAPDQGAGRQSQSLAGPDLLAVGALGQLANHPRVAEFRSFAIEWYLSHVSAASTRAIPEVGPQERLSRSGDNLPNVVRYLSERHPDRWAETLAPPVWRAGTRGEVHSRCALPACRRGER